MRLDIDLNLFFYQSIMNKAIMLISACYVKKSALNLILNLINSKYQNEKNLLSIILKSIK